MNKILTDETNFSTKIRIMVALLLYGALTTNKLLKLLKTGNTNTRKVCQELVRGKYVVATHISSDKRLRSYVLSQKGADYLARRGIRI